MIHSPKSINLQRSEQNGLYGWSGCQGTGFLQAGHLTVAMGLDAGIKKYSGSIRRVCHLGFARVAFQRNPGS